MLASFPFGDTDLRHRQLRAQRPILGKEAETQDLRVRADHSVVSDAVDVDADVHTAGRRGHPVHAFDTVRKSPDTVLVVGGSVDFRQTDCR
jgi:hypothetical protein